MAQVRLQAQDTIETLGVGDSTLVELVIRHEHQHNETMLQTLELAGLEGYHPPRPRATAGPPLGGAFTGLELLEIPAEPCTIGAAPDGFAYDNERPKHRTDVRDYLIGQTPITNATYLTFVEGGGYERREWWSDEGWAWKEQYDITRPQGWTEDCGAQWRLTGLEPLDPHHPVIHVSWFEADAFAHAHGARLPSETEWEKAATWNQEQERSQQYPWGEEPTAPGHHGNLDQRAYGTAPAGAYPAGASPSGCLGMIGDVWEWTGSVFDGYPGFVAYPYREYSEPFFAAQYRVLRGGSWATRPRLANSTFRNWDHPQRRQIFSGFRIARDA
jgi:iron(II)-dependent oxidoreductase